MSFLILGKTLEQWTFSSDEQVAFLDQWLKADRYKLTTKEFCQSLVENGTDALKQIGQAGLDAPGQGQRFVDVLEGWFPGVVLSSIRAAESAGQRHIGLQTAIEQLKRRRKHCGQTGQDARLPLRAHRRRGLLWRLHR
ncbi:hypothetical protein QYZ41_26185 [Vibrio parahaemolyticus]|nr:hypothetical protein [Vibrio parahaemolyticus]